MSLVGNYVHKCESDANIYGSTGEPWLKLEASEKKESIFALKRKRC